MPSYLHPGVYIEEVPSGSRPIEGVATSVAAFVGKALRGPVGEPVPISSFEDYVDRFGAVSSEDDAMGLAVQAFYLNGGGQAFVCRLASGASSPAKVSFPVVAESAGDAKAAFEFSASSPGLWGNKLGVRIDNAALVFDIEVLVPVTASEHVVKERYFGVSLDSMRVDHVLARVNGRSALIEIEDVADPPPLSLAESNFDINVGASKKIPNASASAFTIQNRSSGRVRVAIKNVHLVADLVVVHAVESGGEYTEEERFPSVSLTEGGENPIEEVVNTRSGLVRVERKTPPAGGAGGVLLKHRGASEVKSLSAGTESNPNATDYTAFYEGVLRKVRDVSVIVLPGVQWSETGQSVVSATLSHCERMGNRMLIVDPPPDKELDHAGTVEAMGLPASSHAVLYYPWVEMANPLYHPDRNPSVRRTVGVAPSAVAAGLWARIDGRRGVWKAPAGVEAQVRGAAGLRFEVENAEQDQLNPQGINCIRSLPGYGTVIWGARTLATRTAPEWRYLPVRRTAIFIEESIYRGIQWAVFEPNDHPLWSALRANIGAFMDSLFRAGAFQGKTAKEAYFVRCGLGDTMTQADIDAGRVIVQVGFAPLKPAEFVIVRIQQKVGESQ